MRKRRYSEAQIIRVLRQVESGQKVKDVIREHGISEQPGGSVGVIGSVCGPIAHSKTCRPRSTQVNRTRADN